MFVGLSSVERFFDILSLNSSEVPINVDLEIVDFISPEEVNSMLAVVKGTFLFNDITIPFGIQGNFHFL